MDFFKSVFSDDPLPPTICTQTPKTTTLTRSREVVSCTVKDLPGSLEVGTSVGQEKRLTSSGVVKMEEERRRWGGE
ncbi:hypothetical protein ACFXTH_001124 [Malus domestica]